jgi:hypothetical protein
MHVLTHLHIIANNISAVCPKSSNSAVTNCGLPTPVADHAAVNNILQIVFGIMGAIAFLIVTIAGLRYITSAGDPQKAANARNTIIFALLGLAIAITAEAIITFVVKGIS